MYTCSKAGGGAKKFRNSLISRPLPTLRRGYISFHHFCGNVDPTKTNPVNTDTPENCTLTLEKDDHQEDEYTLGTEKLKKSIIMSLPQSRMMNNGSLADISEWFYDNVPLPRIQKKERVVLTAEFDSKYGGFGADNIHFHTPQR